MNIPTPMKVETLDSIVQFSVGHEHCLCLTGLFFCFFCLIFFFLLKFSSFYLLKFLNFMKELKHPRPDWNTKHTVHSWGSNEFGQLGISKMKTFSATPKKIPLFDCKNVLVRTFSFSKNHKFLLKKLKKSQILLKKPK